MPTVKSALGFIQPVPLVGLAVLAALPLALPSYWLFLATSIVISAIAVASVGIVTGMAGMVSLCQLAFAGVAGWIVTYFTAYDVSLPFALQVLIGGLTAVPLGVLVGLPALRLRGVNLAIVTLSFASVVHLVLGLVDFPNTSLLKPVAHPGFLASAQNYYWFCLAVCVLVLLALRGLPATRLGSAWLAVKHSERATAALGLSVSGTKLTAFAASAFIAGISGGLLAGHVGLLSARNFEPVPSLVLFAAGVMVGARYPGGAMLAASLQWLIPELLNRLGWPQDISNFIFTFGTIQALSAGGGVFEQRARANNQRRASQSQSLAPPTASATAPARETPSATPVLEIQNLTVRYGQVLAVEAVSLVVSEGSVIGLIGPNGAGKSSLVDAVTGFTPYQGRVLLAGQALEGQTATRRAQRGLRRTFQQDRTILDLSAQAYLNLAAGRTLHAIELRQALDFAGLRDGTIELHGLNIGARRLLEVAGVLAAKPKAVLLDEPAAGLSNTETRLLGQHIAAIPARYGCAVLLIEHDMELVHATCQAVTVIDFGKVLAHGPTQATLSRPDVIAAYLGEELVAA